VNRKRRRSRAELSYLESLHGVGLCNRYCHSSPWPRSSHFARRKKSNGGSHPCAFYRRHHTEESPHYEKAKDEGALSQTPLRETLRLHWGKLVRGVGIYLSVTVPFYTLTVFLNGFLTGVLGYSIKDALISTLSISC
jgi:hypothetical protein